MDGLWHHVVVSVPQDKSLDDVVVYVDNSIETTTGSGSTSVVLNTSSSSILTIGRDQAGTYLNGYIDDVRVWERSIAASEVDKLYELEKPTAPPEPELSHQKSLFSQPIKTLQPVEWRYSQLRRLESLSLALLGRDRTTGNGRTYPEPLKPHLLSTPHLLKTRRTIEWS